MQAKLTALFTTGSGLSIVLLFLYFGFKGIQTYFTGSISIDIGLIITILGAILHPTEMVGGRSLPKRM